MAVLVKQNDVTTSAGRFPLRFATGTPIVLMGSFLYKGNAVSPTSFSNLDSSGGSSNPVIGQTCIMVSGTLAGKVRCYFAGMPSFCDYMTTDESGTTTSTSLSPFTLNTIYAYSDLAVDGNGNVHIIYCSEETVMGTAYITLFYTNNIGGSFKTGVEIWGGSNSQNINSTVYRIGIMIDGANFPIVYFKVFENGGHYWSRGNAVNATSFANVQVSTNNDQYWSGLHQFTDSDGNRYIFYRGLGGGTYCRRHSPPNSWISGNMVLHSFETGHKNDSLYGLKVLGNDVYMFFKDLTNNPNGMSIAKFDITSATPSLTNVDHAAYDCDYNDGNYLGRMKATPLYHNYDATGTDRGVGGGYTDIDFVFASTGTNNFDTYWEMYPTVAATNVSKIKVTSWKDWAGGQINIGGSWKTINAVKINIGGVWKDADITP